MATAKKPATPKTTAAKADDTTTATTATTATATTTTSAAAVTTFGMGRGDGRRQISRQIRECHG